MKLRLEDQSVRFRLSPDDADQLERENRVNTIVALTAQSSWEYSIEGSDVSNVRLEASGGVMRLLVPKMTLEPWLRSTEIELNFIIDGLHLAVEKDLKPHRRS